MLMEPTTVVAKAWEQVRPVGERSWFEPKPGARHRCGSGRPAGGAAVGAAGPGGRTSWTGLPTDRNRGIVAALGATYHHDDIDDVAGQLNPDIVIEATGVSPLVFGAIANTAPYGIVCLTGVSPKGKGLRIAAGTINRDIVLENDAVVGSVNANLRHYHQAADALAKADSGTGWRA